MKRNFLLLCCMMLGAVFADALPESTPRIAVVPLTELPALLQQRAERILLPLDAWEDLQRRGRMAEAVRPPQSAGGGGLEMRLHLREDRVWVEAEGIVEGLAEGLHELVIAHEGIHWTRAQLDDAPAELGGVPGKSLSLYFEGRGPRRLQLGGWIPLREENAMRSLRLVLPDLPVELRLFASSEVEIVTGAVLPLGETDDGSDRIEYLLSPSEGQLHLVFRAHTLNDALPPMIRAHHTLVSDVDASGELLSLHTRLMFLNQSPEVLYLNLPASVSVFDVTGDAVLRWQLAESGEVEIHLRKDLKGAQELFVRGMRENETPNETVGEWSPPLPKIRGAEWERHLIALRLKSPLRLQSLDAGDSHPVPASKFLSTRPEAQRDPGEIVGTWFLAGDAAPPRGRFHQPPVDVNAVVDLRLSLLEDRQQLDGGVTLVSRGGGVFDAWFSLPADWELQSVLGERNEPLVYEIYAEAGDRQRVQVFFGREMPEGTPANFRFRARRVPGDWLTSGGAASLNFPDFDLPDVEAYSGGLSVQTHGELSLRATRLEGLTPMDENEKRRFGFPAAGASRAWRFEEPGYALALETTRLQPELQAEIFSFFRMEREALHARYEIIQTVRRAWVRELSFTLPVVLPVTAKLSGEKGTMIGEFSRVPEGEGERWTVRLAEGGLGEVHLSFEAVYPLETDKPIPLPLPRVAGVEIQSGHVTLEGTPEFETKVLGAPRPVDVGETSEAVYVPGSRLLGTYMYLSDVPDMTLVAKEQPLVPVPNAMIRRLRLLTWVSRGGIHLTEAWFEVEADAGFISAHLPGASEIWSVRVDSRVVEPRLGGNGHWLIPLQSAVGTSGRSKRIQLLYAGHHAPLSVRSRLQLDAPRLAVHEREGETPELLTIETEWELMLPNGFHLDTARGTARPVHRPRRPLAVTGLARALWMLGGGHKYNLAGRGLMTSGKESLMIEDGRWFGEVAEVAQIEGMEVADMEMREPAAQSAPPAPLEYAKSQRGDRDLQRLSEVSSQTQPQLPGAVTGFRSLSLGLQGGSKGIRFTHLGDAPALDVTLNSTNRWNALAWGVGLLVFVGGLFFLSGNRKTKMAYILGMMLLATLLGALPGLFVFVTVFNAAFYAAALLFPFYVIVSICRWMGRPVLRWLPRFLVTSLFLVLIIPPFLKAEEARPTLRPLPDDLWVMPASGEGPQKILIPVKMHESLMEQLQKQEKPDAPDEFTLSWLASETRLSLPEGGEDRLLLHTTLRFRCRGAQEGLLPLMAGTLKLVSTQAGDAVQLVRKPEGLALRVTAPGEHELRFSQEVPVADLAEGKQVETFVPGLVGHRILIQVPPETELHLMSEPQARFMQSGSEGGEEETFTQADGQLKLRWRSSMAPSSLESVMQIESTAVLDLQREGSVLVWDADIRLRGTARSFVDITPPSGWRIGEVEGENVRGRAFPDEETTLRVHFLRPVNDRLTLRIHFFQSSDEDSIAEGGGQTLQPPVFPGAMRHTGQVLIRNPENTRARIVSREGFQREELDVPAYESLEQSLESTVLEAQPFQVHAFFNPNASLRIELDPLTARYQAQWERIFRIAQREQILESRCRVRIEDAPLYALEFVLPPGIEITSLVAPGSTSWHVEPGETDTRLTVHAANGWTREATVILIGRLQHELEGGPIKLPGIQLSNAHRETGEWVIQADPFYHVETEALDGIRPVPVESVYIWLDSPQRPSARLALRFERGDHSGAVVLRRHSPEVTVTSFTNLRVTDRIMEETHLLDFRIRGSGVREFIFEIPAHLAEAHMRIPLLRSREITPIPGDPERLRVRVELQDEVMDQLLILLEHDRALKPDSVELRGLRIRTGRVGRSYFTLENAGRDELRLLETHGLETLTRQHAEWALAAAHLRGEATHALISREGADNPVLSFELHEREQVQTAGAGIGLAKVVMVMDDSGAYRAQWTGQVDNRTEQFLIMELPETSRLLMVTVAGKVVRPAMDPAGGKGRIRIPLVKTAAGELDVPVTVIYGGQCSFRKLRREGFPFARSVNIATELSQAELHLPRRRKWLHFDGSMSLVDNDIAFQAGELQYQTHVAKRLAHTLESGDEYGKARARFNFINVSRRIEAASERAEQSTYSEEMTRQRESAFQVLSGVETESFETAAQIQSLDNRLQLNAQFDAQGNTWGRNQVLHNPSNFAVAAAPADTRDSSAQQIDYSQLRSGRVGGRAVPSTPEAEESLSKIAQPARQRGQQQQIETYANRLGQEAETPEEEIALADPVDLMPRPDAALTQVYRFTTPRGDLHVTAWSLSPEAEDGWIRFGAFLAALLLSLLLWIRLQRPSKTPASARGLLWLGLGLLSMLTGFLPVYGMILFAVGICCLIFHRRERKTA
jgi:hypothetical protein